MSQTTTFAECVELFLADAAHRCSPGTVIFYRKRMNILLKVFANRELGTITKEEMLATINAANYWPDGRSKAPDTIRSNVITWTQLQEWLIDQEILSAPITKKISKPNGRKRELLPTIEETKSLIANGRADFIPIFRALRLTGCRPGELCKAEIKHLDWKAGEIVLTEHKTARKTGKPRRIAIGHPALVAILQTAIGDRESGHIFMRNCGKPWNPIALGAAFRQAKTSAGGLRKGLVLYLCRHEHATELYKATGDLKCVADALGHSQLSTTMRYTRVDSEQLKKNQRLFGEGLDGPEPQSQAAPQDPKTIRGQGYPQLQHHTSERPK